MSFLEIKHLKKCYGTVPALHDISLSIAAGEFITFLGPSGCGKTTLLNCIAGLTVISAGTIFLDGKDITGLAAEKRHCGVVFQNYALFPNLTVRENVAYGLCGWENLRRHARVAELLDLVALSNIGKRYPAELSGGQQQRVALARALAPAPRLLLLDEPLSALDACIRAQLAAELRRVQRQIGVTAIMVTHDQQEAMSMADRIVLMHQGRIEQIGSPDELYHAPKSRFAASFIGTMNIFNPPDIEENECGIRYEDVLVCEATEFSLRKKYTWVAKIVDKHSLGSVVRLELLLQDCHTRIYADMLPAMAKNFFVDHIVAVRLPRHCWRLWKDACA